VEHISVWAQKGKKISASHQGTNPYIGWAVRLICSLSADKEMISRQADLYINFAIRPNCLTMAYAVYFRTTPWRPGSIHNQFLEDKWHWQGFCAENFELNSKCCTNIHETKIVSLSFNNFPTSLWINYRKPNQLQTANKETLIKITTFLTKVLNMKWFPTY